MPSRLMIAKGGTLLGDLRETDFKYQVKVRAKQLGLTGEARALSDGSVEINVEGPASALDQFARWCKDHRGVEDFSEESSSQKGWTDFFLY